MGDTEQELLFHYAKKELLFCSTLKKKKNTKQKCAKSPFLSWIFTIYFLSKSNPTTYVHLYVLYFTPTLIFYQATHFTMNLTPCTWSGPIILSWITCKFLFFPFFQFLQMSRGKSKKKFHCRWRIEFTELSFNGE